MDEFYRVIEDKIRQSGYEGPADGEEIYNDICDQMEDKEEGVYVFMSKKTDHIFFEYKVEIFEDQFNLSYIDLHTPEKVFHVDFDS